MAETEILDAMQQILNPIKNQLESLDLKIDMIQLNQRTNVKAIRKDIQYLNDEVDTLIAVMEAKGILSKVEGQ